MEGVFQERQDTLHILAPQTNTTRSDWLNNKINEKMKWVRGLFTISANLLIINNFHLTTFNLQIVVVIRIQDCIIQITVFIIAKAASNSTNYWNKATSGYRVVSDTSEAIYWLTATCRCWLTSTSTGVNHPLLYSEQHVHRITDQRPTRESIVTCESTRDGIMEQSTTDKPAQLQQWISTSSNYFFSTSRYIANKHIILVTITLLTILIHQIEIYWNES